MWPDRDFRPQFLYDSLAPPMIVKTVKDDDGWELVNMDYDDVVFTGLSEEDDWEARLEWHRVGGKWEASRMRVLADGVLEVTRKRLVPYLLHPEAQDATSTALYRPFTGQT